MEEKTSIILSHRREGMSIREIARRNGMSRKTVRKYLREFEREAGPSPTDREVDDYLLTKPKYDSSGRVRRVMTDEVRRRIDGFIAATVSEFMERAVLHGFPLPAQMDSEKEKQSEIRKSTSLA